MGWGGSLGTPRDIIGWGAGAGYIMVGELGEVKLAACEDGTLVHLGSSSSPSLLTWSPSP